MTAKVDRTPDSEPTAPEKDVPEKTVPEKSASEEGVSEKNAAAKAEDRTEVASASDSTPFVIAGVSRRWWSWVWRSLLGEGR